MSIIDDLVRIRKVSQRTQEDLARAAGLTRMSINRAEAGTVDPKLSSVVEMARALGMELMLVPSELQAEVAAFLQSGGRVLGQPAGASAPPSIVDTFSLRPDR